jgi:hypothetical protein
MDYMTEFALRLWPLVAGDTATTVQGWSETLEPQRAAPTPDELELATALETAVIALESDAGVWKQGTEHARLELLVDALYQNPELAQRAVRELRTRTGYLGPRFIQELASLAVSARRRLRWGRRPVTGELQPMIDELMGDPRLVLDLARRFQVAMPFTLVLHQELEEINASRSRRLSRDPDAQVSRLRRELEEAERALRWQQQPPGLRRAPPGFSGRQTEPPPTITPSQTDTPPPDSRELELTLLIEALRRQLERALEARKRYPPPPSARPSEGPPVGEPPVAGPPAEEPPPPASGGPFRHPLRRAQGADLVGLALSGGGIRSATFNLGVLQGLADLDLLRRVDYLSSVSGGGYIGSWLAAWCKRCLPEGIRLVQRCISPARSPNPHAEGLRPLRWLREFSNYLTPKLGFFSADTWTMIAIWLRNTLLNQTILVLFLAAVLLIPRGPIPALFLRVRSSDALISAAVLLTWVSFWIGLNLRAFDRNVAAAAPATPEATSWPDYTKQGMVQLTVVVPTFVAAFLLTKPILEGYLEGRWLLTWVVLAIGLFLIQLFSRSDRCFYADNSVPSGWAALKAVLYMAITSAISGGIGTLVLKLFTRIYGHWANGGWKDSGAWHAITFGPPLLILILSLITTAQIGLLGRNLPDERREWWSRVGAWTLIYILGWLAICGASVYGPMGLAKLGRLASAAGLAWIASTFGGVMAAKSAKETGSEPPNLKLPRGARWRRILALAAPYVFVVGLLLALSFGLHRLILYLGTGDCKSSLLSLRELGDSYWTFTKAGCYQQPLGLLVAAAFLSFALASRVDVNEFSMHHFYKNRLVRCYLGASRPPGVRRANRFTGFDRDDDFDLAKLRLDAEPPYLGPYPIINTALNLVKGENLAWQERKASSFVFTPWYSGYEYTAAYPELHGKVGMSSNGYRLTEEFAYRGEGGIGLGTATAISGAASNPNMGYHSSPAATFLLTVFNARLGWWLGNPRHESAWRRSSPGLGLLYHFNELVGNTSDRSWFVNLSDGGHFENLGIYELVRRRCRYIIACDSEQDAALNFGGLGNAIRKCRTDFGVDIAMAPERIRIYGETGRSQVHCVVGTITYPDNRCGKLLYLKASLTGDEPADVLEYQRRRSAFPHQTTGDQWFDESQFESYRMLGHHVSCIALRHAAEAQMSIDPDTGSALPGPVFEYLESLWYPPSSAIEAHFTQHAAGYDALLERIRGEPDLQGLDSVLFPDPNDVLVESPPPLERDQFYTYAGMTALMQSVFLDLDLENTGNHPHNAGWVRIFHRWASDPGFRKAWYVTKETYGERFRKFCETELNLPR